jgi:microcystin synthetase protein McyJ
MPIDEIAKHYTERHALRRGIFGSKPYSNYGYWSRPGMTIDEACDAMAELVARAGGFAAGQRVLEVGCGYGASAVQYAPLTGVAEVVGIDATPVRVEEARAYVKSAGLEHQIHIDVGDAIHTGFAAASFDHVLAMECAFHFDSRRSFFAEAFRVLRPNGVLTVTDIIVSPEASKAGSPLPELRRLLGADQKKILDTNIYDADRFSEYLRDTGFVDVAVRSIKTEVVPAFADHLERVALSTDPDRREPRLAAARAFRTDFMYGADYVLVTARKPNA